jgi:hypothetical protein
LGDTQLFLQLLSASALGVELRHTETFLITGTFFNLGNP